MTCVLAVLHGLMMTPLEVLQQRQPSNDEYRVFDYIWSFYSTVFVFSTLYFFLYCAIRREKAYVARELVIPSALYGLLWSSGMTFWFLSSHKLSQVVAYPITTRLPAIISAIADVGRNNLLFLAGAIGVGIIGVLLIALSNL
ncbi:unnamed protein product [Cylicostephanus goldi]|uniref:Uncharacterized protein n=1 Tax=Cylicostephanus goldi TaxID=71465 RepID=A0A3P7MZR1_CYLGO|nr:unnamed protein product [Cylicostephanus goldi]